MTGQITNRIYIKLLPYRKAITKYLKQIRDIIQPAAYYIFKDKVSGETFLFLFIGWDTKLCFYWVERFSSFLEPVKSKKVIIVSKNINKFLKENQKIIDIAIVESGKNTISQNPASFFLLPRWMEMELNIESSLKTEQIKKIKKSIKKYCFRYEIKHDIESLTLFYYSMYKPYTLKRHGKSSFIADYNYFYSRFRKNKCLLFFLLMENTPVAATFIEIREDGARLSASGIKDASEELLRKRVTGALRYFIMNYYRERGINTLLVGSCMPVVTDGVTEYKLQIGATPYLKDLNSKSKFYFIPNNAKSLTLKILKENPLFYLAGASLKVAFFCYNKDIDFKQDFSGFLNLAKINDVEITRVFCFYDSENVFKCLREDLLKNEPV